MEKGRAVVTWFAAAAAAALLDEREPAAKVMRMHLVP